jgi:hypothetical protein
MINRKKLVVKFPSRGRPEKFFNIIDNCIPYIEDKENTYFLLTLDEDDTSMNNKKVLAKIKWLENFWKIKIIIEIGTSKNKIDAVNRDLDKYQDWDILLLLSDDMIPKYRNFDNIIRNDMDTYFPDGDGILYYPDGFTPLNTLCVLGKKYYNRFGYIYNPEYNSFFCDNAFHEIADLLHRQYYSDKILFFHEHPCNTGIGWDPIYERNNTTWDKDMAIYAKHKLNNYGLGGK